jgi:hypothetical protein
VLDLFDSGSSASGDEAAAPMPRQKCPLKISSSDGCPKTFGCPCYERYIRIEFLFFISIRAAGLTLALVGTIIESVDASAKTGAKDSRHGGVDVNEQVTCVGSVFV